MYSAVYENENGLKFVLGKDGGNVFDLDVGDGVSVNLGTSQGFSQIGENVETQSVGGRPITVKGAIFQNVINQKKIMRKVFAPFTGGTLTLDDGLYIRAIVKDPPTFSPVKDDGRFTMQLYAPFPYFYSTTESFVQIGGILPAFKFPVNYEYPHKFGEKAPGTFTTILNEGEVKVPFGVQLTITGTSTNPTVTNLLTFEFLKINGSFSQGDFIHVYRDENNVLRAELTGEYGSVVDIISQIDEDSNLFELNVGDNLISVNDNEGGAGMVARIVYSPAVVAWYES